jgi:hypothetical protein
LNKPQFERSVFINCPFDDDFAPILQAIAFCVTDLGFSPRLAPENGDNAASRLDRILTLIRESKYSIHDISRCKSEKRNEYYRMNIPFELGIDYGCREFGNRPYSEKAVLILEATKFDSHKTLSDISGWDIDCHNGQYDKAIGAVRNWLNTQCTEANVGAERIRGHYADFQAWYYDREIAAGASDSDIRQYPTIKMIQAMQAWKKAQELS